MAGAAISASAAETPDTRPNVAPGSYQVDRYTVEQGLPHNKVLAVVQTRDGYLWIGTLAGLARFDGVRFTVFDRNNTPEMRNDAINALAEDRQDGSLWINTGECLLRYYRHQFERFDAPDGFPHPFGRLWPARSGGVWYSPRAGQLVLLRSGAARTWSLGPDQPVESLGRRVVQVEEDGTSLLVLTLGGMIRLEETGALTQLGPPVPTDKSCRHFLKQPGGTILLAAEEGLWRRDTAGWKLIEAVGFGEHQCPDRICRSRDGGLWIPWRTHLTWNDFAPARVARFREGQSEFLNLSQLSDCKLNDFLEDREGHLWIGTEAGLYQLRPQAVRVYARGDGLRSAFVKSLTQGPDGTIWLGTTAGVSGIKDGQVTNLPPVEPSNWGRAEGLLADRRGRVWYGVHYETVKAFDQGAWVPVGEVSPSKGWLRTLYEDRSGRIWAGSDLGVAWLDEVGETHQITQTLSHPDVRVIHQDRRGDLWFGTFGGGLNRWRDGKITSYSSGGGEYNNRAWCIHEDADGVFWVGSRDGLNQFVPLGLEQLRDATPEVRTSERFFTFTIRHGLRENLINNVQEDDFGYLWLSGVQGIYRISRDELNEVAAGRKTRVQVLAFGEAEGMLNSQCNGGVNQPSGCKDRAGRIWFPTAQGAAVIDPAAIRLNEVPPPVVIEQVKADDEVIYGDQATANARLPASSPGFQLASVNAQPGDRGVVSSNALLRLAAGRARVLEIRYTGNSFAAPRKMRFKFRLEGHDLDWRYDDHSRVAFYTNLRPGAYRFQVDACNNHGVWSEAPAEWSFVLAPHFWQTWAFTFLASVILIGAAAGLQAFRLHWQRRLLQLEHQQALADERTRIARDLHDDLGTALTGPALQFDVLRRVAHDGPGVTKLLVESATRVRRLAEHMREVVWAVNPRCDTVPSLAGFLEQQASLFRSGDGVCRLDFPEDIPALPLAGEARHQLALSVREALANVVRHAAATEVVLALRIEAGQLIVRIVDNGRGFCVEKRSGSGHGLLNLQERLKRIGGSFDCRSEPGRGTTIELRVPLSASPNHS